MKIIGIDYGSVRVGIATADTNAGVAFPKTVLENNRSFFDEFKRICEEEKPDLIVLGESKDYSGNDNLIMQKIKQFRDKVENEMGLSVAMHPEFLTSAQASRLQDDNEMLDASAAAIILQAFLDKSKNNE